MPEEREISAEDAGHLLYLRQKQESFIKRKQVIRAQLADLMVEETTLFQERQEFVDQIGMRPGDTLVQREDKYLLVPEND
jgi:hypothetical protein